MEQQRRWTVMVVPHGSDSPRSISVSVRALRAAGTAAGILGLVAMIGLGVVVSQVGSLTGLQPSTDAKQVSIELADLRDQLRTLQDTIATIGRRDEQRPASQLDDVPGELRGGRRLA